MISKFGFYQVDQKISFSKLEALEWGAPTWNFNDEVFLQQNWKQEPTQDLWTLYKNRALQIRNTYDYVVIFYSGGSDSHNILSAWLEAGCKIDEIATTWNYETTGDYQNHQNAEITNVVLPDIKKMRDMGFKFTFRLIDIPPIGLDVFNKFPTTFEYFFNFNFQISSIGKQFLREAIKEYKQIIDSGKRLAFVWGKEKPYLFYEDGKFYFQFVDSVDDCVGPYSQSKQNQGWFDELFYWSPDMPELPIKMAHVVKNYLRICDDRDQFNDVPYMSYSAGYSPRLNKHLKIEALKSILYPKWSNLTFCNGKSPSRILGLRDEWFKLSNNENKQKTSEAIKYYLSKTKQKDVGALGPIYSKKYWLE
jgi:hypothetical protein